MLRTESWSLPFGKWLTTCAFNNHSPCHARSSTSMIRCWCSLSSQQPSQLPFRSSESFGRNRHTSFHSLLLRVPWYFSWHKSHKEICRSGKVIFRMAMSVQCKFAEQWHVGQTPAESQSFRPLWHNMSNAKLRSYEAFKIRKSPASECCLLMISELQKVTGFLWFNSHTGASLNVTRCWFSAQSSVGENPWNIPIS